MPQSDPVTADRPANVPWPPLLLAGAVAGAIVLGWASPLPWPGLDDLPARAIGLGLGAAGVVLLVVSILTLIRGGTTVRPDAGASALITSGPYRRWRNPIYLADTLILLGLAELTKNAWFVIGAVLFGVLVTWLAILPEERYLERRFGAAYRDYKAKSRRWL